MADNRQRGLIGLATDLGQQGRAGMSGGAALPDNGAAQAFNSVAGEIEQFGKKVGQWADHAAQVEGAQAGELAGLDPEFRPSRSMTIRGEAFDKAGLGVMQAKLKQDIHADFEGLADKHGNDPKKIAEITAAMREKKIAAAPEEIRAELTLFFDGQRATAVRSAARAQRAAFVAEQQASALSEVMTHTRAAQQMAYQLGLDPAADQQIATARGQLERVLSRKGADGKALFSPSQRVTQLAALDAEMAEGRIIGAFSRLPDLDAKQKAIEELRADYAGNTRGIAKAFTGDQFRSIENRLASMMTQDRVAADRQVRAVQTQVGQVMKQAEKGFIPGDADMRTLETAVHATKNPEVVNEWADAAAVFSWMRRATTLPPEQLDQAARALREDMRVNGSTPRKLKLAEQTENLLGNMRKDLKDDPLGWASKAALDVPEIDPSPANFVPSIAARVAAAETVGAHYGVAPKYLRPDERKRLALEMSKGGDATLQVASAVAAAAPEKAAAIMAEIGEHGPTVAHIGALLVQTGGAGGRVAQDAANGLGMLRIDGYKPRAKEAETRLAADALLGGLMTGTPRARQALIQSTNAAYEVRAARAGKTDFDADLWQATARELLGEHRVGRDVYGGIARGGRFDQMSMTNEAIAPVIIPPFVKQSGFAEVIDTIRPDDLIDPFGRRPVDAKGRDLDVASVRRARLVTVGPGRYLMQLGTDPDDPQFAGGGTGPGGAYVLDLNRLAPALAKRRPDLFLKDR